MKEHKIKCWPPFFDEIVKGNKTFEIRENDRDYREGDRVILQEFDPNVHTPENQNGTYTGKQLTLKIGYVMKVGQTHRWANAVVFSLISPVFTDHVGHEGRVVRRAPNE